jgi:hypothetical protein
MKTIFILLFLVSCQNDVKFTGTKKPVDLPIPDSLPIPDKEPKQEEPPRVAINVPVVVSLHDLAELFHVEISPANGGYSYSPYNYGSLCTKLNLPIEEAKEILQGNAVNIGGYTLHFYELEVNRENALEYVNYLDNGGEKLLFPKTLGLDSCDEHGSFKDSLQSIHGAFISECMKIPLNEFSGVTQNDKAIAQDLLCNKNRY